MSNRVFQPAPTSSSGTKRLEKQRTQGGLCGGGRALGNAGISTDSAQSKGSSLCPPVISSSVPLLQHQGSGDGSQSQGTHLSSPHLSQGIKARSKREIFKWSGVTVSFDADSVKIENEVNGGLKTFGKEVGKDELKSLGISFHSLSSFK